MSFGGATFITGAYSANYKGADLGISRGSSQQPALEITMLGQPIDDTDAYGRMPIGAVRQGATGQWVTTLLEWKPATIAALWPVGTFGQILVGADDYDSAGALILTPQPGTLAFVAGGIGGAEIITAAKAVLATNVTLRHGMNNEIRELPIRMQLYPFIATNTYLFTYS